MKKYLLSIGEVSALTGVHISSLRYYDKIGVLPPAYIDPFTKYRYYAYSQLELVYAIRACIALGVPLKEYHDFIDAGDQRIRADELLAYAKQKAQEKLRQIKSELKEIEHYQQDIERSRRILAAEELLEMETAEKHYFAQELLHTPDQRELIDMDKLPRTAERQGYQLGDEFGLLYFYGARGVRRYQIVEVQLTKRQDRKQILTVPAGRYWTKAATPEQIEAAPAYFPSLFDKNKNRTVLLTELFTENIDVNRIVYELRCYL